MTTKPPKIELTFGKNDLDLYVWIVEKNLSNATFIKRMLRDKMNEEKGAIVTRSVVESSPVVVEPEIEPASDPGEGKPAFGFLNKMGAGKEF